MARQDHRPNRNGSTDAFAEIPVSFPSDAGSVLLSGTFVIPSECRDAPAVVLVSGTGPIDRDVTFVGHSLFRVVAHSLARAGIASLRFDKRGVGESGGDFSSAGPDDFVSDVLGAMKYLFGRKEFSSHRVGLLGHSEGGMVAMMSAARMREVPFIVLLASPFLSGRENLARSFALLARGGLERDSTFDLYVSELDDLVQIARSEDVAARREYALELATNLAPLIFNERTEVVLGAKTLSGAEFLSMLSSRCLETCLSWDPIRVAPLVTCPALVIYGGRDVQAPALENVVAANALINQLGRDDWSVREIDDMNHAFQRCRTGMPDEYASIKHVMADEVINEVAGWIHSRMQD